MNFVGCQATTEGNTAVFRLSIVDFDSCGLTKVVDRSTVIRYSIISVSIASQLAITAITPPASIAPL